MPEIYDQVPFAAEFADNPEPRCPSVLLRDTASSTPGGQPIAELDAGLRQSAQELQADSLAAKRGEAAVVSFGPVHAECEFTSAAHFMRVAHAASGNTPMGQAITRCIELLPPTGAQGWAVAG
jgi:uncharacterized protein YegL